MSTQTITLSMSNGELWLTEGNYSAPFFEFENSAKPLDVIQWIAGKEIFSFENVFTRDHGLFRERPVHIPGGFEVQIGRPFVDPGSYSIVTNGRIWDPKIRVISEDCKTNTPENTSSALANN